MKDHRIHRIKEHLSTGLAIMDVVGHVEDLGALWHRDSVACVMHLAFKEWKAANDLLSYLEEEQQELGGCRSHVPDPMHHGTENSTREPPNGLNQQ